MSEAHLLSCSAMRNHRGEREVQKRGTQQKMLKNRIIDRNFVLIIEAEKGDT